MQDDSAEVTSLIEGLFRKLVQISRENQKPEILLKCGEQMSNRANAEISGDYKVTKWTVCAHPKIGKYTVAYALFSE